MSMTPDCAARNCARCGHELTDAASMEVGIGPICRKLDSALLATLIPADVPTAQTVFHNGLETAQVPAICFHTLALVETVMKAGETNDWRETVKRIEWLLSFSIGNTNRETLIKTVECLGYIGLASLWRGEAATGPSTVVFENGRLWLVGPRNKAGTKALRAIPGRAFHPASKSEKATWSVPASSAAEFRMAILTHWPNNQGLIEALIAAKEYEVKLAQAQKETMLAATVVEKVAYPTQKKSTVETWFAQSDCLIEITPTGIARVKTPYSASFVAEIKSLPYKNRKWVAAEKVWEVIDTPTEWLVALLKKHYPGEEPVVKEIA